MNMKLSKRNYIYIAVGLLLLALLTYFLVLRGPAVTVELGQVTEGPITVSIDAEGRTRYHDRYTITAPVTGNMFRIQLHEGDRVPKGLVLARIDPAPTRPLDPVQTPPGSVFPYASYNVYVPEDGILTRIFVSSEGIVQAGTPIAEVGKPSLLEVVTDVLSSDATHVRPHMPVRIENWGGEGVLSGRVRSVEPKAFTKVSALGVEEQRVNVIVDLDKVPESLGDNYKADVKIVAWEGNGLRVPSSALYRTGEKWAVYVVQGSRARERIVEVGHRSPSYAEVLSGLNVDETVILHPPTSVSNGTRISGS